jgi:hypothetical protein
MSPTAQRIAIAKACGWEICGHAAYKHFRRGACVCDIPTLPDYLADLNAMHEAITSLPDEMRCAFNAELMEQFKDCRYGLHLALNATAAQRAEAFLRTLNLWSEAT